MKHSRKNLFALASILLVVALSGCATAKTKSSTSSSGSRPKTDCKTCYRMCEVGGDASKSKSVEKCKSDCDSKCK